MGYQIDTTGYDSEDDVKGFGVNNGSYHVMMTDVDEFAANIENGFKVSFEVLAGNAGTPKGNKFTHIFNYPTDENTAQGKAFKRKILDRLAIKSKIVGLKQQTTIDWQHLKGRQLVVAVTNVDFKGNPLKFPSIDNSGPCLGIYGVFDKEVEKVPKNQDFLKLLTGGAPMPPPPAQSSSSKAEYDEEIPF